MSKPNELHLSDSSKFKHLDPSISHYPSVTSTMDKGWSLLKESVPEQDSFQGKIIVADKQTKGRGRHGNQWSSPEGGIWSSILFSLPEAPSYLFPHLTVAGAISIVRTIKSMTDVQAQIRWPNDVVVLNDDDQNRNRWLKLAGVLVESKQTGSKNIPTAVMGMGINLNISEDQFPSELREEATSLSILTEGTLSKEIFLNNLFVELDDLMDSFLKHDLEEISKEWEQFSAILNRRVRTWMDGDTIEGTIESLSIKEGITLRMDKGGFKILKPAHVQKLRLLEP